MKTLFEELTEEELSSLVLDEKVKDNFDTSTFKDALDSYQKEIEMYESLGKEFRKEFLTAKRLYNNLSDINNWMSQFNNKIEYTDKVIKVKAVCRIHASFDKVYIQEMKFEDYRFCSGIFTPLELYIIPNKLLKFTANIVENTPLEYFKALKKAIRDFELSDKSEYSDELPTRDEAVYGTIRPISQTHSAIVVKNQENPIHYSVRGCNSWRYIYKDGSAA